MKTIKKLLVILFILSLLSSQITHSSKIDVLSPDDFVNDTIDEYERISKQIPQAKDITVSESENSTSITLKMTYNVQKPTFSKLSGYSVINLEGCDAYLSKPGEPTLPVKTVHILLPPSVSNVSVKVVGVESETISGDYFIFPAQEAAIASDGSSKGLTKPDAVIYSLSSEWPSKTFEVVEIAQMREYRILGLRLFPIKYVPSFGKVIIHSQIKLSVSFKKTTNTNISPVKYSEAFEGLCQSLVVNPMSLNRYSFSSQFSQEEYKYIVITPSDFVSAVSPLVDWKTGKGIPTKVFTIEEIASEYEGEDLVEQIRNCLIDSYQQWGIEWVLLCGDVNQVPIRLMYSPVGEGYDPYAPSDYYYADLTGEWDSNGNGKYGEVEDDVDWFPEVYVGRLPARTASELTTMVTKIINYEKNPPSGDWSKRMLFAGAFLNFENEDGEGYPETDVATLLERVRNDVLPASFSFTRLYEKDGLDPSDYTSDEDLTFSNLEDELGVGYIYVMLGAHGMPQGMGRKVWVSDSNENDVPEEDEMSWPTMISTSTDLTNKGLLSLIYADSCLTARIDYSSDSLAERMIKSPNGAIAYIGATRVSYYSVGWQLGWGYNQEMDYRFWDYILNDDSTEARPGVALYKTKLWYSNNYDMTDDAHRHNLFVYILLGDPELSTSESAERDFTVSVIPDIQSVQEGAEVTYTVKVQSLGSFASPVSLGLSGAPTSTTFEFNPDSVTPSEGGSEQSTLTISTTEETPTGTYTLTVFGRSGVLMRSFQFTLIVNVAGPDFNITANPDLLTLQLDSQGNSTITVASLSGFNSPVSLNVSGVPFGVTAGFIPSEITPPSNGTVESTLLLIVDIATVPGTYILTVSGNSSSTIHFYTIALTIVGEEAYNVKISDLSAPSQVGEGQNFLVDITVEYSVAFDTTIFIGVWDYGEEAIITGGVDDVTQTSTQTYVFELNAPERNMVWNLAGVALYWNGSDWEYNPEGWYWDFEVLVSGAVNYSAQVIGAGYPTQVELGTLFSVEMTIEYSLASSTEVGVGIWDYGRDEYITEEVEDLTGAGSNLYSFNLMAPSTPTTMELSADVWYKLGDEWVHDVGTWYIDFQVEVSVPRYPDLVIIDAWIGDIDGIPISKLMPDNEFYLWSTLKNHGDSYAENYYIDVYFEGEHGVGGPGSLEEEVETYWYYGPFEADTGTYEVRWIVNQDHTVTETNYGNNENVISFQIEERPFLEQYGMLIAIGVAVVFSVAVIVYIFLRRRRKPVTVPETTTLPSPPQIIKTCSFCGTKVPLEALYCPECGQKIL